jgi:hypothetical protein
MSQTFPDWNQVPAHLERKVRSVWNGSGTATYDKSFDRNNDPITVYKLADYKVALNTDYLTTEQKVKLFDICADRSIILSNLLHSLSFEIETIRVYDEIYHLPGMIVGTWPDSGSFGGMDETGYVHT